MYKFIGLVGTNSKNSTNRQLLQYMKRKFNTIADIEIVEIDEFPLFNKPKKSIELPKIVCEVVKKINSSDGVIISTPEYDHTIPAVLNNALAWLSYNTFPLVDKPVMITGASYGVLGSSRAQQHLRQILDAPNLKARIMPSSEFLLGYSLQAFDYNSNLVDEEQIKRLATLFIDFITFVKLMENYIASIENNDYLIQLQNNDLEEDKS